MPQNHCSDESLIAYLDGELSLPGERRVRRHLQSCWSCRNALHELEDQVKAVARALQDPGFPEPEHISSARRGFLALRDDWERTRVEPPRFAPLPQRSFRRTLSYWFAAAACLGGLAVGTRVQRPAPDPPSALAEAERSEGSFLRGAAVHQKFRIAIEQVRPVRDSQATRLEVWSDFRSRRFRSSWQTSAGKLRHALWRAEDRAYVYDRTRSPELASIPPQQAKPVSLAALMQDRFAPQEMERAFERWLETRNWTPVRLVADFAAFTARSGAVLTVERRTSFSGESVIRLTARKQRANVILTAVLDVERRSGRAFLETIRVESGERILEFSIALEQAERLTPALLAPAIFEPDLPVEQGAKPHIVGRRNLPAAPVRPAAAPDRSRLGRVEIQALYALHHANACLGEPVEVVRDQRGVAVDGLVETLRRKSELLDALAPLRAFSELTVEIRCAAEAAIEAAPAKALEATPVRPAELPLRNRLAAYFRSQVGDDAAVNLKITALANGAVSGMESALAHAWAVRRLAERYSAERMPGLRDGEKSLLRSMLADHLRALQVHTAQLQASLDPPLAPVAASPALREGPADSMGSQRSWGEGAMRLFAVVNQAHGLALDLFGGTPISGAQAITAAGGLIADLASVDAISRGLEIEIRAELHAKPELLTSSPDPQKRIGGK